MVKVITSGLLSSIQDLGRHDYRGYGVPVSGVMDAFSTELANAVLGNNKSDAVLEITMTGPSLHFLVATQIVITGANMSPMVNGKSVNNNKLIVIRKDDVLSFGALKSGLRAYLAVKGGFKTKKILNSRSYYKGITQVDKIKKDDVLRIEPYSEDFKLSPNFSKLKNIDFSSPILNVFKGPEYNLIKSAQIQQLNEMIFMVSSLYNRMAYQLEPVIENDLPSILTSPVLPGTVQLTPSGRLIVLMRDCQTSGGYPRILQLTESAINLLSQKKQNDQLSFKLIDF